MHRQYVAPLFLLAVLVPVIETETVADHLRELQKAAEEDKQADWGRWGKNNERYSSWTSHSNRLIPIYTFGMDLKSYSGTKSIYRRASAIEQLYGRIPSGTLNSNAQYFDQTDVYRLQRDAIAAGKKHIILIVFDGMDWQTTQAAAIYNSKQMYTSGRGTGLSFLDYSKCQTDYGFFVTSPHNTGTDTEVDPQLVTNPGGDQPGGYDARIGGAAPWAPPRSHDYLLGKLRRASHAVTDSAASATSMTSGIKTFNAAINVDHEGQHVVPIGRQLQLERGFAIGVVTSVPISHATPAAAYGNNVSRNDYQDLTRDLLGLPSISHRRKALPGVDVLLGGGWGEESEEDERQGENFSPGNKYLAEADLAAVNHENGGAYQVVQRTAGQDGNEILLKAAKEAFQSNRRLLGFFGASGGNLPYQTADGEYNPYGKKYSQTDVDENPTLAELTRAALGLLAKNEKGFWLMIEAGDVDWANHDNNIDNSIGATLSGDAAFKMVCAWVEKNDAWDDTAVILTADHGHYFRLEKPGVLMKEEE